MNFLILLAIIMPVLSGAGLLFSKLENSKEVRNFATIVLALTAAVTVVSNVVNFGNGCTMLNLPMGMSISFSVDMLAAFFSTMFVLLWLVVGIYSREYFKSQPHDSFCFSVSFPSPVLPTQEKERQIIPLNISGAHYPPINYTIIIILLLIIYNSIHKSCHYSLFFSYNIVPVATSINKALLLSNVSISVSFANTGKENPNKTTAINKNDISLFLFIYIPPRCFTVIL